MNLDHTPKLRQSDLICGLKSPAEKRGMNRHFQASSSSTPCVKKNCNIVLSELHQISTNFENFWHTDGKEAEIMWGA